MLTVDLNCDMGEGMSADASIFPYISSANIACGYHAGSPDLMRTGVELALRHQVAVGAHPSYPDKEGFGRTDLLMHGLQPEELPGIIVDQLIILQAICDEFGTRLHHVKPHGALYNRAAADAAVSALICRAIRDFDPGLLLYGLSGSQMAIAAERSGLTFVSEVFADRTYRGDGSLTPRTEPHALITDAAQSVLQVLMMVEEGKVIPHQTTPIAGVPAAIPITADSICLHGDGAFAPAFAKLIHEAVRQAGIGIEAP